jgi:hypothetical protein
MVDRYLSHLKRALDKPPKWWLVSILLGVIGFWGFVSGSAPLWIRQNWSWFVISFLCVAFLTLGYGSLMILDETTKALQTRIFELQHARNEEMEKEAVAARDQRDDRDTPEVIEDFKREYGAFRREHNIHSLGHPPDVNWLVGRLKARRDERLVRKAYSQWKADNFPAV